MSDMQKSVLKSRLPPMMPSRPGRMPARTPRDYTPISWDAYFDQKHKVKVSETDTFCAFTAGEAGQPILCLLHGGGFSALTWSLFTKEVISMVHCQVLAFDLRGHGSTVTSNDEDLSAETLARDVGLVIEKLFPEHEEPVLLVGHSMGGAIAVHAAHLEVVANLAGVAVIDVVEGTAMDALASMQSFLRGRPKKFASIETAIEWSVRSGQIRNCESARVSMPGQLKNMSSGEEGINCFEADKSSEETSSSSLPGSTILEEEEEGQEEEHEFQPPQSKGAKLDSYTWRIDLGQTEKYWSGWFKGLSEKFLNLPVAKMLLLAGIDRLDKELMVGQMQGKFQMQVLSHCGHTVHEDTPDKVAEIIATFLVRHKLAAARDCFERSFPEC